MKQTKKPTTTPTTKSAKKSKAKSIAKSGSDTAMKSSAGSSSGTILIKSGAIHTASDSFRADLLVEHGKIVQIAAKIDTNFCHNAKVINAAGLDVFPGGIDVHTHFELPFMGAVSPDDFSSGTVAAACGGTTTIVDFVIPSRGQRITEAAKMWHNKADGKCAVDYGFHIALVEFNDQVAKDIPKVIDDGVTSFKCFLAYKNALMVDDAQLLEILYHARENGALVSVHAENGDMLTFLMKHLLESGNTAPRFHSEAHPAIAEAEATHRAIVLASMAAAPLYIVHMSCNEALEEVKIARSRGQMVLAETCPQYLLLDDELYNQPGFEGAKWVMSPPLRHFSNQDPLWEGLRDGFVQTVATDHCSFNYATQKKMGKEKFTLIPNGIPGVGDRMNLLYTYGVCRGRFSPNQFAAITATNPARIFGMYPQKGTIAVGSDADLVFYDPKKKGKITDKNTLHNVDYSAYNNFELDGLPVLVLSRGVVVSKDQKFTGDTAHGRFLKRQPFTPSDWGFPEFEGF